MSVQGDLKSLPKPLRERLDQSEALRAWDVSTKAYGPRVIAFGTDGVVVLGDGPEGDLFAPWEDVEHLSFPTQFQVELKIRDNDAVLLTLQRLRHRAEMLEAVTPPHQERLRLAALSSASGSETGSAPAFPMFSPSPRSESADAVAKLWNLTAIGLGMQLIGVIVLATSWHTFASTYDEVSPSSQGNAVGLLLGWLVSGAGAMVLLVAVIGFGTMLGVRAARRGPH